MTTRSSRAVRTAAVAILMGLASGCGGADAQPGVAEPNAGEIGVVTLVSDDSSATVPPVCVDDIPEDLTACAGAPANLGQVELDETRKASLQLPTEVATSGYRIRINGLTPPGLQDVLNDKVQPFRVPESVVEAPGETVVIVEALSSFSHRKAVWQFLLSDPATPTAEGQLTLPGDV